MSSRLTPADQQLARIRVNLSERFGKDVDPRVREIAESAILEAEDDLAGPVVSRRSETSRPNALTVRYADGKVANYLLTRTKGGKVKKSSGGRITPSARLRTASQRSEGPAPSS